MTTHVVALDVGGTSMKGGLVTAGGDILLTDRRPTPRTEGPGKVIATIREFIADLAGAGETPPTAVGVVVPGPVSDNTAVYSSNIGWRDVPASDFNPLDVPIRLGHDVRSAGLAESVLGAARHQQDFLFLSIGTGIAGAMILNNTPYPGATGWSGEIGHIPVFPTGEQCACGQTGCLETYASAASIARRYTESLTRASSITPTPAPATPPTAEDVITRAERGDPQATEVWNEALEALTLALATYTLLLDPTSIVLGGGLSQAGPTLSTPVAERLQRKLTWRTAPQIHHTLLGTNAGMLGAALLAWKSTQPPTPPLDVPTHPPVP
ncbi:ROK family protein [Sphaerisporangium rubeum]|uniref:Glucokinase n=1 Tax=Sphaerisporangium rubeum TaxID=321317 RepID=A0A7X0IC96_9ACTN|nr:ROK family protein [Sphaerisporangium rubeum]MBB6472574.1 glucokinase [Sphaerisporangium rubeum]